MIQTLIVDGPLRRGQLIHAQHVKMCFRFDTLRNDCQSKASAKTDDRLYNCSSLRISSHAANEWLVNFDFVEREQPEAAKGGITRAEIVHRDLAAKSLQSVKNIERTCRIAD